MKVILKKDVPNVGEEHEAVEVSEGYARNYLFPRNLGQEATKAALAELEKNKRLVEKKKEIKSGSMKKVAEQLSAAVIEIKMDAGEGGKLFGSVTNADISAAIKEQLGLDVEKKKIELAEHIKMTGEHSAKAKLFTGVEAVVKINVVPNKQQ